MVRRFWPNDNPIGKQIRFLPGGEVATIVGVVGDVKHYGLDDKNVSQVYSAYAQNPHIFATLAVRTVSDPMKLAGEVRSAVWAVDKDQPVWKIRTLESLVILSVDYSRLMTLLLTGYSILALVLAAVGVYGVISYTVSQQTHEIGVRMALGAQGRDVCRLMLRKGLILVIAGVAAGLGGAFALTRVMEKLLFNVSVTDPLTFVAISLLLSGIALLAIYIPARRATKVDPMVALRYE
jgi:putative ABC transport system permease protein